MPVYLSSALADFSDTGHPCDTERCAGGAVLGMRASEVYLAEDGDAIAKHMLGETDGERLGVSKRCGKRSSAPPPSRIDW